MPEHPVIKKLKMIHINLCGFDKLTVGPDGLIRLSEYGSVSVISDDQITVSTKISTTKIAVEYDKTFISITDMRLSKDIHYESNSDYIKAFGTTFIKVNQDDDKTAAKLKGHKIAHERDLNHDFSIFTLARNILAIVRKAKSGA